MRWQAPERRPLYPDRGHQKRALCALLRDEFASDVPAQRPGCRREERAAPPRRREVKKGVALVGLLALAATSACNEYTVRHEPPPKPADPPETVLDATGEPPSDWENCSTGYYGQYFDLTTDDAVVEPDTDAPALDLSTDDLWTRDRLAFQRFDPSLEFGANWWPVDEGIEGDPQYFAVRWTAWIRAYSGTTATLVVAAESQARVTLAGEEVATIADPEVQTVDLPLEAGQFPLEIRFAHVAGSTDTMRFRVSGSDVKVCYPEFPAP